MKQRTADLLLHPIRMRIIQSLIRNRRTVQELQSLLPEVPQATLYRHLQKLVSAGLVQVVRQRQVRGAVEKTYALAENGHSIGPDELKRFSREDHLRYFMTYFAHLLESFAAYVGQPQFDMAEDGAGYRQAALYLNETERMELAAGLAAAIRPYLANDPSPERRGYTLATILIPEVENKS